MPKASLLEPPSVPRSVRVYKEAATAGIDAVNPTTATVRVRLALKKVRVCISGFYTFNTLLPMSELPDVEKE